MAPRRPARFAGEIRNIVAGSGIAQQEAKNVRA
jgi:hypothetical protein